MVQGLMRACDCVSHDLVERSKRALKPAKRQFCVGPAFKACLYSLSKRKILVQCRASDGMVACPVLGIRRLFRRLLCLSQSGDAQTRSVGRHGVCKDHDDMVLLRTRKVAVANRP